MEHGMPVVLAGDAEPDLVMQRVTERFVTGTFGERHLDAIGGGRFAIVYQDRRRITVSRSAFSYRKYFLWALLLIVPGLIYKALAEKKALLTTVEVGRGEAGKTEVSVSGNDPRAKEAITRYLQRG